MNIEILQTANSEDYERYVSCHRHGLFYYSLQYKKFLCALLNCQAHYLVAIQSKKIVGILPLMTTRVSDQIVANSLPYFGSHGGPLASHPQAASSLIAAYNDFITQKNISASTLITSPFAVIDANKVRHNFTDYRIGMFTDLSYKDDPQQEIFNKIAGSARRNIKHALSENITVTIQNDSLEDLKQLHQINMKKIGGAAKDSSFFNLIPEYFNAGTDFNIYIAKYNEEIVAALLLFYYGTTVEYFTPAIHETFASMQPLSLLIFTAMVEAARKSMRLWNWGGTWASQQGVYQFKKKWSSYERPYHYLTQVNNEQIIHASKENLLARYPGFYVMPFGNLVESKLN